MPVCRIVEAVVVRVCMVYVVVIVCLMVLVLGMTRCFMIELLLGRCILMSRFLLIVWLVT